MKKRVSVGSIDPIRSNPNQSDCSLLF